MSNMLKMRRVSIRLILLLTAATLALSACTSTPTQAVPVTSTTPTQAVTTAPITTTTEPVSDEHIRENLAVLFDLADDIDTSKVNIFVNSGVVTLSGSVDHLWQKDKLEEIALSEASVVSIDNYINVIVITSVSDQEIFDAVNKVIARLSVDITAQVENGVVTLSGIVSCCDEPILVSVVSSINGVIQVVSNFTVVEA